MQKGRYQVKNEKYYELLPENYYSLFVEKYMFVNVTYLCTFINI